MRLEDICTVFTDGDWIESKDQSDFGIRLIQTGNIGEGTYLEKEARAKYISEETFGKLKCTEVFSGDILVSRLPEPVGRACIVPEKAERMITAVDCTICRPNESLISKEYLCYFLRSNAYYTRLLGNVTGTTRKRISRKNLGNVELRVPAKDEQKVVVEQLDCLVKVIDSRTKELQLLDDLIKARFVEMFKKCNNYELLGDADILISDGNYSSKYPTADEFVEEGVPFIRASNMVDNTIIDDEMYHISAEKHAELLKGHVKPYDVLIATRGAGIGKIAVVPERHNDSNVNAQIVLLRCNKEKYNPLYLSWYLKLQDTQIKIQGLISGSAQPQLPIKRLVQLELLRPDIEKQNDFAIFVHQVDKSKVVVKKALEETQLLFDSLMQEYFG